MASSPLFPYPDLLHKYFMDNILGPDKQTFVREIVIIFLLISLNMCFGCSKELSQWDSSFEYPQHMFK